jgi:cbb3-type cytochrome oxidase subunit 3
MWLLILEALLALSLLLFAVWWTMFSGRRREEPAEDVSEQPAEGAAEVPLPLQAQAEPARREDPDRSQPPPR